MQADEIITIVIMSVTLAVLIGWDIYVAFFNEIPNEHDTESGIMRKIGNSFVGVPFAWGALGGHFWGPSWDPPGPYWVWPLSLCCIALVLSALHYVGRRYLYFKPWFAVLYVVAGVPLGALMWPQ